MAAETFQDRDFICPGCKAKYKLVRVPSDDSETLHKAINCSVCGTRFASHDNGNILKYFLVSGSRAPRGTR